MNNLHSDISCLLNYPEYIVSRMGWTTDTPFHNFKGVKIYHGRITELHIGCLNFGDEIAKKLVFPPKLRILTLCGNNISNIGLKQMIFPSKLNTLNLFKNNIDSKGIKNLILPPNLCTLYLTNNNIGDEGLIDLILPPTIQILDLSNNNITAKGICKMKYPADIRHLNISFNNISIEELTNIPVLPFNIFVLHENTIIAIKMLQHKSNNEIKQSDYEKLYIEYYNNWNYRITLRSRIVKEICRGLYFGNTDDKIFSFLKDKYGNGLLRQKILTYINISI